MEEKVKCLLCDREVFENKDKCILHCNKDDWYTIQNEKKFWNKKIKLAEFWKEIKLIIENISDNYIFYDIIFPIFEHITLYNAVYKNKKRSSIFQVEEAKYPLVFNNCLFLGKAEFNHIIIDKISFIACHFEEDISLSNSIFDTGIEFKYTILHKNLFIVNSNFDEPNESIDFYDVTFNNRFVLRNIDSQHLTLQFVLVHFNEKAIIDISQVTTKNFFFYSLYNFSKIFQLREIEVDNEFKIENTSVNNLTFINCLFENTNQITFKNVSFKNTRFDNVKWGKINSNHFCGDRDSIRQLKHLYDQQGNYIQANKFYSFEMEKYSNEILEKIKKGKIKKYNLEWCVFSISKNLSNFSQNWLLPIFWFLFLGSMFFDISLFIKFSKLSFTYLPNSFLPCSFILIFFIFKIVFIENLLKKSATYIFVFASIFLLLNIIFYALPDPENIINLNEYLLFLNPFHTKSISKYISINALFITFKLISIVIGYQLVTALRFHTRRK